MSLTFKEKKYGYKIYGDYGDTIGKIETEWYTTFHPKNNMCLSTDEIKEIVEFMEQLECLKESL